MPAWRDYPSDRMLDPIFSRKISVSDRFSLVRATRRGDSLGIAVGPIVLVHFQIRGRRSPKPIWERLAHGPEYVSHNQAIPVALTAWRAGTLSLEDTRALLRHAASGWVASPLACALRCGTGPEALRDRHVRASCRLNAFCAVSPTETTLPSRSGLSDSSHSTSTRFGASGRPALAGSLPVPSSTRERTQVFPCGAQS